MDKRMNMDDLKNMSTAERIQMMKMLWDSMQYEGEEIGTPEWHETILKQRKTKIRNGNAKFISLSELKSILKK